MAKKFRFKSGKINAFEAGQRSLNRDKLKEAATLTAKGRLYDDGYTVHDAAGRAWVVASFWGIASKGVHAGEKVYYMTTDEDLGGAPAYLYRVRTEAQLIAAHDDLYLMMSGIEAREYRRVNGEG